MHQFLSAVGFHDVTKREDIDALIREVIQYPTDQAQWIKEDGTRVVELSREFGEYMGIAVRGEYNLSGEFEAEYYFPYFCGKNITTAEHVDIEKHSDREAYAGVCDDPRIGITLIFYLQNALEYFTDYYKGSLRGSMQTALTGLVRRGMILLPVVKEEKKNKTGRNSGADRLSLIQKAKDGDEEAIESLTLEDIDTYSMLSRRIEHEDVLTIVNTYFMPYGIESDQYAVLGEILDYHYTRNVKTGEDICIMTLNCNSLVFDVCVNEQDLVGQPEIGRRFKGVIWMQGAITHM